MATTRNAPPPEGGRVVVVRGPREMDALYRDVTLTRAPANQDIAVAFDVARQADVSVGTVLARLGAPDALTARFRDVYPGREKPEAVREPAEDAKALYERQVAARLARERREMDAFLAEQDGEDEPSGIVERVVAAAKHIRFSQSPAGQRARRARRRAKELGISFEEAEAMMAARRAPVGRQKS